MNVPFEFVPPTLVLLIAATVWGLARIKRIPYAQLPAAEMPAEVDYFATDIEPLFAADEIADSFDQIAAANQQLEAVMAGIVARDREGRVLPKPRRLLPNPRTSEEDPK